MGHGDMGNGEMGNGHVDPHPSYVTLLTNGHTKRQVDSHVINYNDSTYITMLF